MGKILVLIKNVALMLSIFGILQFPLAASAASPVSLNKWKPGHYVKVSLEQLTNSTSSERIYAELASTPALRGVKIALQWGRHEKKVGDQITYDFSQLKQIHDRLASLEKHLILSFSLRAFGIDPNKSDVMNLLPNDLATKTGLYGVGSQYEHMTYANMYAYAESTGKPPKGYNIKLWKSDVLARMDTFFAKLAAQFDSDNVLVQISTTESALGSPVVPYGSGTVGTPAGTNIDGSEAEMFGSAAGKTKGQLAVWRSLNKRFVKTPVVTTLNFTRLHVKNVSAFWESEKFTLGTPDSNKDKDLNFKPANLSTPKGVLLYYPEYAGRISLVPEIQTPDYVSSVGDLSNPDYPKPAALYQRVKQDLHANYVVWQRIFPYWLGGTISGTSITVPSVLQFLKTNPEIINDRSGAGGLDASVPIYLK